jgi:hypothetical protein
VNGVLPLLFAVGFGFASLTAASAHEVRPAYLESREEKPAEFSILFKTPMQGDARLALRPSSGQGREHNADRRPTGDAMVQTWRMRSIDPLAGQKVSIWVQQHHYRPRLCG